MTAAGERSAAPSPSPSPGTGAGAGSPRTGAAAVWQLLREREFAALVVSGLLSDVGNYVARIAVAVLVLEATGSALLSATVFAIAVLPTVVGDALFGPLADRWPKRAVMVGSDLLRAGLVGLLLAAVAADLPLPLVLALLFLLELAAAPANAAYAAVVPEVLPDRDRFLLGNATLRVVNLADQVLGLALGGVVVAALSVEGALWIDLATFVASAVLVRAALRARPASADGGVGGLRGLARDVSEGWAFLRGAPAMSALARLAWAMSLTFSAPLAVALAYAEETGSPSSAGSWLLAAEALGGALGAVLSTRWPHVVQVRRILPAAAAASLVLLLAGLQPALPLALLVWGGVGLLSGVMMMPLLSTFTLLSPPDMRGRLNGLAGSGFAAASTAGYLVAGAVADAISSAPALVVCAALGCLAVAVAWPSWPRRELRLAVTSAD